MYIRAADDKLSPERVLHRIISGCIHEDPSGSSLRHCLQRDIISAAAMCVPVMLLRNLSVPPAPILVGTNSFMCFLKPIIPSLYNAAHSSFARRR